MESRPWCLLIAKQHTGHHYGIQSGRRPWLWRCNEKDWVPAIVDLGLEGAPRKVATLVDTGMTLQFATLWNSRNRIATASSGRYDNAGGPHYEPRHSRSAA